MNIRISRRLKEELAWAVDKRIQVISNKMLFKTLISLRKLIFLGIKFLWISLGFLSIKFYSHGV